MRVSAILFVLVSLAACAQPGRRGPGLEKQGFDAPGASIPGAFIPGANVPGSGRDEIALLSALPGQIGPLRRQSVVEDHTPGILGGAWLPYSAPGIATTIYLFRRDPDPIPEGPDSTQARNELALASAVAQQRMSGQFGPPETDGPRMMVTAASGSFSAARCSQAVYPRPANTVSDFTCVTGQGGRMLKLRLTMTTVPGGDTQAPHFVRGFLAEIQRHLAGNALRT